MSEEQLKAFLEKVKADTSLQDKLKAATDSDAILAIAKDAGFSFAAGDLKADLSKVSDAELETAAGGQVTGARPRRGCAGPGCAGTWNQVRTWTVNWVVCLVDDALRE